MGCRSWELVTHRTESAGEGEQLWGAWGGVCTTAKLNTCMGWCLHNGIVHRPYFLWLKT